MAHFRQSATPQKIIIPPFISSVSDLTKSCSKSGPFLNLTFEQNLLSPNLVRLRVLSEEIRFLPRHFPAALSKPSPNVFVLLIYWIFVWKRHFFVLVEWRYSILCSSRLFRRRCDIQPCCVSLRSVYQLPLPRQRRGLLPVWLCLDAHKSISRQGLIRSHC